MEYPPELINKSQGRCTCLASTPASAVSLQRDEHTFGFLKALNGPASGGRVLEGQHDDLQGLSQAHDIRQQAATRSPCRELGSSPAADTLFFVAGSPCLLRFRLVT